MITATCGKYFPLNLDPGIHAFSTDFIYCSLTLLYRKYSWYKSISARITILCIISGHSYFNNGIKGKWVMIGDCMTELHLNERATISDLPTISSSFSLS